MKLFKFCAMNHDALKMIINETIWFSKPSKFNDYFDSNFKHKTGFYWDKDFQEFYDNFGITCFSKNMSNPNMWAYYADSFKGFCIEYELDFEFNKTDEFIALSDSVKYDDNDKPIDEMKFSEPRFAKHLYFQKCSFFEDESEYRILAPQGEKAYYISNLKILKIHYGPKMQKYDIAMLVELCKLKNFKYNSVNIYNREYLIESNENQCLDDFIQKNITSKLYVEIFSEKSMHEFEVGTCFLTDNKKIKKSGKKSGHPKKAPIKVGTI